MKLNRAATKARLTELVLNDPAVAGQSITYGMPVDGVPARGMFFGQTVGPLEIANMKGGAKEYNDRFQIHGIAYVTAPGLTQAQAESQVTDVLGVLLSILSTSPNLGGTVTPSQLRRAEMTQATLDSAPDGDGEGYGAWITFEIACESRLT